ncbi:uncharacterized protein BXZ73DRAFT_99800 [Epithele typhae]|uniref:uncharacterized protein n=1 Tax=Epithele typhae TaxID=378194 RepID=UPI0020074712|nr:uncharacterized protein BXZ73DRAFT_99800 [Epithele typhae]KAH9939129.1 hypothetical protein BXZ73DRAFT_99800 [Epithele typhae]
MPPFTCSTNRSLDSTSYTLHHPDERPTVPGVWGTFVIVFSQGATTGKRMGPCVSNTQMVSLRRVLRRWEGKPIKVGIWKDGDWIPTFLDVQDDELVPVQRMRLFLVLRVDNWERPCRTLGRELYGREDGKLQPLRYGGVSEGAVEYEVVIWTQDANTPPTICYTRSQVGRSIGEAIADCTRLDPALVVPEGLMDAKGHERKRARSPEGCGDVASDHKKLKSDPTTAARPTRALDLTSNAPINVDEHEVELILWNVAMSSIFERFKAKAISGAVDLMKVPWIRDRYNAADVRKWQAWAHGACDWQDIASTSIDITAESASWVWVRLYPGECTDFGLYMRRWEHARGQDVVWKDVLPMMVATATDDAPLVILWDKVTPGFECLSAQRYAAFVKLLIIRCRSAKIWYPLETRWMEVNDVESALRSSAMATRYAPVVLIRTESVNMEGIGVAMEGIHIRTRAALETQARSEEPANDSEDEGVLIRTPKDTDVHDIPVQGDAANDGETKVESAVQTDGRKKAIAGRDD